MMDGISWLMNSGIKLQKKLLFFQNLSLFILITFFYFINL